MSNYCGYWQEKSAPESGTTGSGKLIVLRLTPYGWDGQGHLTREEALPSAQEFQRVEDLEFPGEQGAHAAIRQYLRARAELMEHATELVPQASLVLFVGDLQASRPKTAEEALMDEAMLRVELDEFDRADALLASLQVERDSLFAHTIRRRSAQNRVAGLADAQADTRRAWMQAAAGHGQQIIDRVRGMDLYRMPYYGFGDHYRTLPSIVASAAATLGSYLLDHEQAPQRALTVLETGADTCHGDAWLYGLMVRALVQLDRREEAFALHKLHSLQLPEVLAREDYQHYLSVEADAAARHQAARIAAIQVSTTPGRPMARAALAQVVEVFGALPEDFSHWLCQQAGSVLQVQDGDTNHEYRVFSPDEALERHTQLMAWLYLHGDRSSPMTKELFELLDEDGIDPTRMLPLIGNEQTPDCFLLRLDGEQRGQVYFWSHDERANFEPMTTNAADLFAYLSDRAKTGNVFSL